MAAPLPLPRLCEDHGSHAPHEPLCGAEAGAWHPDDYPSRWDISLAPEATS